MPCGRSDSGVDDPRDHSGPVAPHKLARRRLLKALGCSAGVALFCAAPSLAQPSPAVLPDGRGWELVSPAEKAGASINPLGQSAQGLLGGPDQASEDGNALTYSATAPVEKEPEANRAPEGVQIISRRTPTAWVSKQVITPHNKGEGLEAGAPQEYRMFSPDLSLAAVQPFGLPGKVEGEHPSKLEEPPLTGSAPEERGIYLRHNQTCEPVKSPACFEPVVTPVNNTAKAEFGEQLEFVGGSRDLTHMVFRSRVALTPEGDAPLTGFLYEWDQAAPGQLHLVSVPATAPEAVEPEATPQLGFEKEGVFQNARNAISQDGSRVFWTTQEFEGLVTLFVRDTTTGKTMEINVPEAGVKNPSREKREEKELETEVRYQGASADGKRVFFTSTLRLTKSSEFAVAKHGPADLYACDLPAEITETSACSTLTDLSVATLSPTEHARSAEVLGSIIGNTDDGNTVYFAVNKPLKETQGPAPNGEPAVEGKCVRPKSEKAPPPSAICNIYMEHFENGGWQKPKLVAVVSQDDSTDWAKNGEKLGQLTARLSPNGQFLAFQSDRAEALAKYNNHDAAVGSQLDEEVFQYDSAGEGSLVCVSCNPNPAHRPTGVFDKKEQENGEENGLLVDPAGRVWNTEGSALAGRWLAGSIPSWTPLSTVFAPTQSRYQLDNGRLFFNSSDALVSFAGQVANRLEIVEGKPIQVGVENVYEYEPNKVGNCMKPEGCVSLISSATSENESAFLEASLSGNDAFFVTTEKLFATDPDLTYDAYDAHVCTAESPCIPPPPPPPPLCVGEAGCKSGPVPGSPSYGKGGTSLFSGPGNPAAKVEVRQNKEESGKGKKPSRKELLAKALRTCKKKYKHAKKKRAACERQARKKYGTKAKK